MRCFLHQTSIITLHRPTVLKSVFYMSLTSLSAAFAFLDKGVIASNRKHEGAKISLTLLERRGNLQWISCLYASYFSASGRQKEV